MLSPLEHDTLYIFVAFTVGNSCLSAIQTPLCSELPRTKLNIFISHEPSPPTHRHPPPNNGSAHSPFHLLILSFFSPMYTVTHFVTGTVLDTEMFTRRGLPAPGIESPDLGHAVSLCQKHHSDPSLCLLKLQTLLPDTNGNPTSFC